MRNPRSRLAPGLVLRFVTKNSWFIGNVAVEGHISDPPNRGQLVNVTRLSLGQPFSEADMGAGPRRHRAAAGE